MSSEYPKKQSKQSEVYKVVSHIPKGKVMTYGQIGKITGINPRLVGRILHENPNPGRFPCHRVVNARGMTAESYAFGGKKIQDKKLAQEGVEFLGEKVNLRKCLYIK